MQKPPQNADELFTALRSALGLANDATVQQVGEELTKVLAAKSAKVDEKKEGEEDAGMKLLTSRLDKTEADLKALSSQIEARDRADLEAQCTREGKELPKTAKELPLDKLRLLCAELPVTVPMEKRTPDVVLLSAAPKADDPISKMTGVSEDDRKKYGGNA